MSSDSWPLKHSCFSVTHCVIQLPSLHSGAACCPWTRCLQNVSLVSSYLTICKEGYQEYSLQIGNITIKIVVLIQVVCVSRLTERTSNFATYGTMKAYGQMVARIYAKQLKVMVALKAFDDARLDDSEKVQKSVGQACKRSP